ncbi:DNA repair protein RecN [Methylocella silvestris]|uniref:DNA repair protein RecN n=1 Tax=Methylocella silvestris TaxID=199596 RepID=A0A2J7TMN4_METSI|nr:DNA repair protein RecN [Methylocella silvestris]PNG28020.1 DNA repair protein RecN [Methylocella silvestris]
MLVQLSIRNIVLIDRLDMSFSGGLSVLTGETGAGKSILLDSFSLALGARGDGSLVREGEAQGQVTAAFDLTPDHPALKAANAQDIETDGSLILRRVQLADGRTRAFVNDQRVTSQALRLVTRELVEIHGQHDDRAMVDSTTHRALIDAYGGLEPQLRRARAAHVRWRDLSAEKAREEIRIAKARADADYLRHAFAELDKLSPEPGEEEALAARRTLMMQSEKVAADLRDAYESVAGDHSPMSALSAALRRLQRREAQAPQLIEPPAQALDAVLTALDLAGEALAQALREADYDPRELEQVEERLFALRAASRKYTAPVDALPKLAENFATALGELDAGEARLEGLTRDVALAEADYGKAAKELSAARKTAASALDRAVNAELAPLKLEGALFSTAICPEAAAPEGIDAVEFWVQTNPGTRPGPLLKIASGGELARFMLALKVVLAERGSAPTLVFDEIDTGVGGAVADAIGQRLERLGRRVQVLAVTHAPQVAAKAESHFRIAKDAAEPGRVATRVTALAAEARREEVARMLAGATITNEARAAAAKLMQRAK